MGHWKRLIKISGDTNCYYCINNITYSIHVYYCPFILVTLSTILFASCHMYNLHFLYSHYSCTLILCIHIFFVVFSIATLFLYNHKHYSMIIFIYFMCRYSYLSSLHYHDTSAISVNSK